MSIINEELARRAKENMSFSDYKPGSATAEYNGEIARVAARIEVAKEKVSPEAQERLDRLFESYKSRYAKWINDRNANGARHVSVMISGPSNYNMRAHEKYLSRERTLWGEYDEFKNIDNRISAIVAGDRIIKSDDANATEKLKEKLAKEQAEHAEIKAYNVQARKEGKEPHPTWVLSNSNGRIKGIKDRIAHLERIRARGSREIIPEAAAAESNGIRIIDNVEANRLQIIFPEKPDKEIRQELSKNGFRWCPTNGAWQRYRGYDAERKAKEIVSKIS